MEYRKSYGGNGKTLVTRKRSLISHMPHELIVTARVMRDRIYLDNVDDINYLVANLWVNVICFSFGGSEYVFFTFCHNVPLLLIDVDGTAPAATLRHK